MPRRNHPTHRRRLDPFAKAQLGTYIPPERLQPLEPARTRAQGRPNHWPPVDREHICPECEVERADWEGPGMHLARCPSCGSDADPVRA